MRKLDSTVKVRLDHTQVKGLALDSFPGATEEFLGQLGISMDSDSTSLRYVMDALPTLTTGSVTTPVQFLQHWMPKAIEIVTQARVADRLLGRTVAGDWHDEEIVVTILEHTGHTRPYGDNANTPLASYNTNYEKRTVMRFEEGLMTGKLEEARVAASATKISAYDSKRAALAASFAIDQNAIAFWGYNNGVGHTYGILNDPNLLPAQQVVPTAVGSKYKWSEKDYHEIVRDINTAISKLRQQTGSNFDPTADKFVLGVASGSIDYLNTLNEHGSKSVMQWFKETFPGGRVMVVPEFDAAISGQNCFYIILDKLNGNKVVEQFVPATMRLLGVEQRAKGLFEAYTNALAGVMVEQPIGIVRYYGI